MKVEVSNTLAYYGKNLITTVKRFVRKDSLSQLALIYYLGFFTTLPRFTSYKHVQIYPNIFTIAKVIKNAKLI